MAGRRKGLRAVCAILFCVYLLGLFYCLFFAESYGRGAGTYAYNLRPFREISRFLAYGDLLGVRAVALNLAGNILGFVPFGALLPALFCSARKPGRTVLAGLEFSLLAELVQLLFCVGSFDVDDVILNTIGVLLGYLLFAGCAGRLERRAA